MTSMTQHNSISDRNDNVNILEESDVAKLD